MVVDRDEPTGRITWVNEAAYRARILPGRRFAEGLSLARGLRAGVVTEPEVDTAIDEIVGCLRGFSPAIEPHPNQAGLCWVDATGMAALFDSYERWAQQILAALAGQRLHGTVVVGWTRLGVYALARSRARGGVQVLATRAAEDRAVDGVALDRLELPTKLRDVLRRLGIATVAALRTLPPGGLGERFGREGAVIQALLTDRRPGLLAAEPERPPPVEHFEIEPDEQPIDVETLLFLLGQRLARMRVLLLGRAEAITALELTLELDHAPARIECVSAAEPTLDESLLLELLRLRVDAEPCAGPVVGFTLLARTIRATRKQLELFVERPKRDLRAANRALARVRAEFGDGAVLRANVRAGHLPEARVSWQSLIKIDTPRSKRDRDRRSAAAVEWSSEWTEEFGGIPPVPAALTDSAARGPSVGDPDPGPRLVRRLLTEPRPIHGAGHASYDWCLTGLAETVLGAGARDSQVVLMLHGPFPISGAWWRKRPVHRDYYYAETRDGVLLWVYEDRIRKRWFVHGVVD